MVEATPAGLFWSKQDTEDSLLEWRRVKGDEWMLANQQMLWGWLDEVIRPSRPASRPLM
jgi:hypothetical protein